MSSTAAQFASAPPSVPPAPAAPPRTLTAKLAVFASDIKIAHTLFALPFALLATFLAADGWPGAGKLGLILLCMVTARTVAMTANRLLDAKLDARNPRTARRAIPGGLLTSRFMIALLLLCAAGFVISTALFQIVYHNPWPLILSGMVLLFLCGYPFLKRFTRLCHYYLGAALGLAPICAWVAIRGDIALPPLLMAAAVLAWTAGFDIIYACQDYKVDVDCGLFSVPSKIGISPALWVSRATHAFSAAMLVALGLITPQFGALYFVGVAISIGLLLVEHSLVRGGNLSRVNLAFFTVNGIISCLVGTLGIIDVFLHRIH